MVSRFIEAQDTRSPLGVHLDTARFQHLPASTAQRTCRNATSTARIAVRILIGAA